MKRFLTVIVCFAMLLSLTACGGKTGSADVNKLVIWHDKEDAVITALSDYLAQAVPELDIQFEKKTSLTDSLKLVAMTPPPLRIFSCSPTIKSAFLPKWGFWRRWNRCWKKGRWIAFCP